MIHDGFIYLGTLMLLAAILVNLPVYLKGKGAQKFFKFAPPIVLLYLCLNRNIVRKGVMGFRQCDVVCTISLVVCVKSSLIYCQTIAAVSYTHLDVYKRQLSGCLLLVKALRAGAV